MVYFPPSGCISSNTNGKALNTITNIAETINVQSNRNGGYSENGHSFSKAKWVEITDR